MHLTTLQIVVLAVVQGLAELLPVSSSAHVIVAEKLMGLNAASPEMTYLLVMLHTGTMFAVIAYFWRDWMELLRNPARRKNLILMAVLATAATGVVGLGLKHIIEQHFLHGHAIENLFGNVKVIIVSLISAGAIILLSSAKFWRANDEKDHSLGVAVLVGAIQGICLPFRGFSRSGATISVGMISGMTKRFSEQFSFLLAVILTPPVIAREVLRLWHSHNQQISAQILPGLLGSFFSFIAGLLAMWWLSRWLEKGKWGYFGVYCLIFAFALFVMKI